LGPSDDHVTETELLGFVSASFHSVWSLELLLFLYRRRDQPWRVEDLIRELRASKLVVTDGLNSLIAVGLVGSNPAGEFQFAPLNPALDRFVAVLADFYRDRPVAVTRAIFQSPRVDRLKTLADAFRLKKD
jgi:hypothetical protein